MSYLKRFKPTLIPSLATLVLLPILLSLGFWQLSRMHEKQTMLDDMAQGEQAHSIPFLDLPTQPLPYTKVFVRGELQEKFSVLLEHQAHSQQRGYHVLTPLEIGAGKPLLWVNRGFIEQKSDLTKILSAASSTIEIEGLIYYPSENRFILGENLSETGLGPIKIQRIVFAELSKQFQQDFYPYILLLAPNSPAGFVRDWEIKTMPPSKHLGYAVQWFALALTLIILYIFASWQRSTKND